MDDLVATFAERGCAVLRGALTDSEVEACRCGLHADLASIGIDHGAIEATCVEAERTGRKISLNKDIQAALRRAQAHQTGAIPLSFSPWRLQHCALNAGLIQAHHRLWSLYSTGTDDRFASRRSGTFDPLARAHPLLDAVGYRVPSAVCGEARQRVQRGLGAHLDLNPAHPWEDLRIPSTQRDVAALSFWRPIQCFVALTAGSFTCTPGLHTEFDRVFSSEDGGCLHGLPPPQGRFFALSGKRFAAIEARMEAMHFDPGDAVLWDSRLAHKTADTLEGVAVREVVYTAFLPSTSENTAYATVQGRCLRDGRFPPSQAFGVAPLAKEGVGVAVGGPDRAASDAMVPGWNPKFLASLPERDRKALCLDV
eukprot:m.117287 g.117287  ORF g.117287 m.117287 type:complete len:367 (-) comp13180_c0_seq1:2414-3514(-)